ncbi:uncharacterized membrane protein YhaH (DUF805 family) [Sulfitobacter undariae]|uniref:Uncharacterized membrane protein YhaH (DUF805 family) n=1 Tax=Sulfitobacter undariae TaxID=1563671 RepID=A0A7W6GYW2_9RHOB|nr:DUF805 domain-containing protein [Sulfitobacter undariae]MBB3992432.1 uncharacterized membrane protein YhaH (DUF805 family) [Sulfitobacter undariae]
MSAQWYYAVEGASHGPVSQSEFDNLVATGTIRSDTLVWQEGMEDWLPYGRAGTDAGSPPLTPRAPVSHAQDPASEDANTFVGALKDGFSRYVDFGTRSTRSQYWWWTLWTILISLGTGFLDGMLGMGEFGAINALASLVTFLPSIAVAIRRLHDIGRSGWWLLLMFIPIIGWIVLIVFYCTPTQEEPNQWGMPPRR